MPIIFRASRSRDAFFVSFGRKWRLDSRQSDKFPAEITFGSERGRGLPLPSSKQGGRFALSENRRERDRLSKDKIFLGTLEQTSPSFSLAFSCIKIRKNTYMCIQLFALTLETCLTSFLSSIALLRSNDGTSRSICSCENIVLSPIGLAILFKHSRMENGISLPLRLAALSSSYNLYNVYLVRFLSNMLFYN